ncbi:hypothetical protein SAMN05216476_1412 [Pseudomonas mediterranea]|uniref:Uncharacterized protein n=1 Tax=Pseudomonas mediterranea TaxID=183795 RepID=A0AAX2D8I4_9PSED|nr:hypothetical protein SAMN05216476_1412 [Pseudomonas mediterranea]
MTGRARTSVARELAPARLRSNRQKPGAASRPSGSKLPRHRWLKAYQLSSVGILRGAMKYSQIRAVKYIAGIRVNNTV